ncbi:MAG: RNA 2',3'-cyclic phosphodiesterase [Candidatus Marinimicrobia bacterium]|jgi:2'-5' RNA ligase|nr:RNA 2',3'-cyclic phosphodiesterase [Candidatus Neomarinimicrobiota bacterium]
MNEDTKRLFVGVPLSKEIQKILPVAKECLQPFHKYLRWVPERNLHITLSFLGSVPVNQIQDLCENLESTVQSRFFPIEIRGSGVFPSPKSPQVFWLGVGEGRTELKKLHHEVNETTAPFKGTGKKTGYAPHITIARTKGIPRKIDVLPFLNIVYSPVEFMINSINLYESVLMPGGSQYTILNEFPLH